MLGLKVLRLNNPFIYHSSLLSVYYVPGIVRGTRNPALNKTDRSHVLMELTF